MNTIRGFSGLLLVALLIAASSLTVFSASLSRDMPSRVDPGSSFSVRLNVPDSIEGESLTVEETLPAGITLSSWDVSGVKESKSDISKDPKKYRVKGSSYGWSVTPTGPVTISYTANAPSSQGNLNFEAVWFDKSGFNRNQATLSVAPAPAPAPSPAPSAAPSAAPTPSPTPAPQPTPSRPKPSIQVSAPSSSQGNAWIWILVLAVIIILGAAWYYLSK